MTHHLYTVSGRNPHPITYYVKTEDDAQQLAQDMVDAGFVKVRIDGVDVQAA